MQVLREVGDAGLSINDIVAGIGERGYKTWDDPRQAKNSGGGGWVVGEG
jgi:hypothetical protein